MHRSVIILDFGGQYSHLIARRVRQCGVYSEILPPETPVEQLQHAAGIILSGGPQSVYDTDSPQADPALFELGVPVFGICYGLQWMVKALGGEVTSGKVKEYGLTKISKSQCDPEPVEGPNPKSQNIFKDCAEEFTVWMSHGDEASRLPEGFELVLTSDACTHAGFMDVQRNFYAVQFHPEVVHSQYGQEILERFVRLCKAEPWSIENYVDHVSAQVKEEVGDRNVFMLVSGGVDSTVAFTLLNRVLGADRVQGLLVDTGMMRKNEVQMIREAFDELGITNLRIEDASEEFFTNLKEVYEPEAKRKVIGNTFLDVQKRVSEEMNLKVEDGWMLGQGTIYPDTIETGGTKHADTIKTHHNRVEAIENMMKQGLVIEPLKELYKDEVRELGEQLGLPHALVWRHPFPGPGLGVRILCNNGGVTPSTVEGPMQLSGVSSFDCAQDDTCLVLPIRSVGVQGDGRSYRQAITLFDTSQYPTEEHWQLATDIPNKSQDFNRVVFCSSHAEPVELMSSPGYLTRQRADLLREADYVVDTVMRSANLYEVIWQFPVVLLPFGTSAGGQSIVLRPVESQEAMTANAAVLPKETLVEMTDRLLEIVGIDLVFYDLTHKPPGTIEWE